MQLSSTGDTFGVMYQTMQADPGGGEGIRTPGLLDATEVLYQLSYTPGTEIKSIGMN